MKKFFLPTTEVRKMPDPHNPEVESWIFYTKAEALDEDLMRWRDVNPREINSNTAVYRTIVSSLEEDPEQFHTRNKGITMFAKSLEFFKGATPKGVEVTFTNSSAHGVVDGAHTLHALLNANGEAERAYVKVEVRAGVEGDQVPDVAGGLNTSQQVDLRSLENLRGHFELIKERLEGQPYADKIAYKMNDRGVDIKEVLLYMALFDVPEYGGIEDEDRTQYPVARLYGRREGVVRRFAEQFKSPTDSDSFDILVSRLPDILRLRDRIEEELLKQPGMAQLKIGPKAPLASRKSKTGKRAGATRKNKLIFLDKEVHGKIHSGFIMPALAAFRANVEWDAKRGTFHWKVDNEELLQRSIKNIARDLKEAYRDQDSKVERVGRGIQAYRACFQTVMLKMSKFV